MIQKNVSAKTGRMVQLAILTAIILLMAFTPIGYLHFGIIEITLIMIPVIIGAIVLGPGAGAFLGGMFGLTSFIQCFGMSGFGAALLSIQPVLTFLVCMIPRILMGWLCGLIFKGLIRVDRTKSKTLSYCVTGLSGALLNTVLFMTLLLLLFGQTDYIQTMRAGMGLFAFIAGFVGLNGLVEAIACFVVASAVSKALDVVMKRSFSVE